MVILYYCILVLTHGLAYYMGTKTQTEETQRYDIYLKWEHERWLEERKARHEDK